MITVDQPTIFPANVRVAVSSTTDGSMKDGVDLLTPEAIGNRQKFLQRLGLLPEQTAVFYADFDTEDFCSYAEARPGLMPGVDGVATNRTGQPILLPIADCVATVLYDPLHHAVMVSHLGRHSTEQYGGVNSVRYMIEQYKSDPVDLLVWLGPSPNGEEYPLWAFNHRSFVDVLCEQLLLAGVRSDNLEISSIDTVTDPNYFSHSQFLQGKQSIDGRYAISAVLS